MGNRTSSTQQVKMVGIQVCIYFADCMMKGFREDTFQTCETFTCWMVDKPNIIILSLNNSRSELCHLMFEREYGNTQYNLFLQGVAGAQACWPVRQTHKVAKLWSHTTQEMHQF